MEIGLVGLQNSGKTAVFNALTRAEAEVTAYTNPKAEPHVAVVDVVDRRVDRLSAIYRPRKETYATVTFIDFVGLQGDGEGFSATALARVKNVDALAYVVRNFPDADGDEPTVVDDVRRIDDEMLLSDLIIAERRLERIELNVRKGKGTRESEREGKVLARVKEQLEAGDPVRDLELTADEEMTIRGFQFLTLKPVMVVVNSHENRFGASAEILERVRGIHPAVEFAGSFEMELAGLDDDEAAEFMADMGIEESAVARLTRLAHEILGYISFFTVGEDEVRAWNLRQGQTAVEAAGTIHSDLARGFIRAECFTCEDLLEHGSEKALKERGKVRLEGRTYEVKDGDVLGIRFSV